MKDRLPLNEDMEVMLTSYLLGELGDPDVRRIELALKESPELRAVAKELEASILVLRQATSPDSGDRGNQSDVPQKLSTDRRNDLITSLREYDAAKPKNIRQLPWFIPMGIAAGLIALLSAYSFMLQTQSPMKDALGVAERMVVSANKSRFEATELLSNSMTSPEYKVKKTAPLDKFRFFRDPATESNRDATSRLSRIVEKEVDSKGDPQNSMSFGLVNDFVEPPIAEVESKNSSWLEAKNESFDRVREKAKKQPAPANSSSSLGRTLPRKALQKSDGNTQGNEAAVENGVTMFQANELAQENQANSDLVASFNAELALDDSGALGVKLPVLKTSKGGMKLQEGFSTTGNTSDAIDSSGRVNHLDAIEPAPIKTKVIEEWVKQRNVEHWAFEAPEDEALFDSGRGRRIRKSAVVGQELASFEKHVMSPDPQPMPTVAVSASSKLENDESRELTGGEPLQGRYRGRMLNDDLLGEQEVYKSLQRESNNPNLSLGKEVEARNAGRFGEDMRRLDDLGDLEELAADVDLNDNAIREEQVILKRIKQGASALQQSNERVPAQAASPAQITAHTSKLPRVNALDRDLTEAKRATHLSLAAEPVLPPKPAAATNVDHRPELETTQESTSTFSMNVSDVSFKLAKAALAEGSLPDPESIRSEQFLNAFDYRDPAPYSNQPIGFYSEQAQHPFAHHRDLVRIALQTAATGRTSERPMHLTILLDNSGSMERNDRREILSQALNVLSQKLTTKDRISVVSFARTARLWVDGAEGGSPVAILEKVDNLMPQGGTNIEEALNTAYEVASDHYVKNGINRVVLLTDGAANLGNVDPEMLKQKVVKERKRGIAFDCFGIGWDGLNDPLLEVLSRNGDGRYGFLNNPSDASSEFAEQLAGALNVAASDVKVQVEFNPERVKHWRQLGYAKHQLTKEQFRDNTVDAAEIASAESGNALYVFEPIESGSGPIGQVRVRYRVPHTSEYREKEWTVPYQSSVPAAEDSSAAMKLALTSGLFAEWLNGNPHAGNISLDALKKIFQGVPETFGEDPRPYELQKMFEQARSLSEL
jgi:Mg-chelatase subunit ChlD